MARTGIRASAIIFKDDKLVLIHRHNNGREYWVLPGGGVEEGETAQQAVVREVTDDKHPVFVCQAQGDMIIFSGPELESDASENNQYAVELASKEDIAGLTIFPDKAKQELLKMI